MKIIVIGEKCLDIFHYGRTTRLNPEAPTPVFVKDASVENEGMAGNVKENLRSLTDSEVKFFHQSPEVIKKERFVEMSHNYILLRVDEEPQIEPFQITEELRREIEEAEAVVVSDYHKGFLKEETLQEIAEISQLSFLDTKKPLGNWAKDYTWIKFNSSEYMNPLHDQQFLKDHHGKIIVTLGSGGAKMGNNYFPTSPVEIMDVAGAGDSFLAGLVYEYLQNENISDAIKFANLAAGYAVSKRGVISDLSSLI